MRYPTVLVVFLALFLIASATAFAQTQTSAQDKAASLRAQLTDIETKQAELQTRLQNLEEAMKPENIEQNLAGVGSTKPEDLREQRRRQLEIERNGVRAQLDLLNTSHSRLEAAVAQADADAYRQSAAPAPATTATATDAATGGPKSEPTIEPITPSRTRRPRRKKTRKSRAANYTQSAVDVG
jgi:hypothetical protein